MPALRSKASLREVVLDIRLCFLLAKNSPMIDNTTVAHGRERRVAGGRCQLSLDPERSRRARLLRFGTKKTVPSDCCGLGR